MSDQQSSNCLVFEVDTNQELSLVQRILNDDYAQSKKHNVSDFVSASSPRLSVRLMEDSYAVANPSRKCHLQSIQPYFNGRLTSSSRKFPFHCATATALSTLSWNESKNLQSLLPQEGILKKEKTSVPQPPPPQSSTFYNFSRITSMKAAAATAISANTTNEQLVCEKRRRANHTVRKHERIFCLRHGERVDFTFGARWMNDAFDRKTKCYSQINLNMPTSLPKRDDPWTDFIGDSPLTQIGKIQAFLTGQALKQKGVFMHYCYSSPSFRCVQTAHNVLEGMGLAGLVRICIEPGLFEYLGWYERGRPKFITPEQLKASGYNIDIFYAPIIAIDQLHENEKFLDYYNRSYMISKCIGESHANFGGNILFCGHAATLEVCSRQLCGRAPRNYRDFNQVIRQVSYLGLNVIERCRSIESGKQYSAWSLKQPPIPHIQHSHNRPFDWRAIDS